MALEGKQIHFNGSESKIIGIKLYSSFYTYTRYVDSYSMFICLGVFESLYLSAPAFMCVLTILGFHLEETIWFAMHIKFYKLSDYTDRSFRLS